MPARGDERAPVVVVGGGISGLSAAWAIEQTGWPVIVLEAERRSGGVIGSVTVDGHLIETGPNSLGESADVAMLVSALGLERERVTPAATASKRFIIRGGRLVALPASPPALFLSPVLSIRGKLRALAEPLVRRAPANAPEESLAGLVSRRLGAEVLDYLVDPMTSGIYAGDARRLSSHHALRPLRQFEREHGSILLGAARSGRNKGVKRARVCSFREGLSALPNAIALSLGDRVRLEARVRGVHRAGAGWVVEYEAAHDGSSRTTTMAIGASAVVLALPAHQIADMSLDAEVRAMLEPIMRVQYAPVASVSLAYPRDAVRHPLDGFGMLTPGAEALPILGTVFASSLFAGRAPDGSVLTTTFVGGRRRPELVVADDESLVRHVHGALSQLLGASAAPTLSRVTRWTRGIPQYEIGYDAVLAGASSTEAHAPGLVLTGSHLSGVAIGDCVTHGIAAGRRAWTQASRVAASRPRRAFA